ncbi:MAG: HEAT repeat domain-containing protein [Planctomycetes bacterium]|nr:HEAT repeat domain-containing protein [Planctomycetota bacterium]
MPRHGTVCGWVFVAFGLAGFGCLPSEQPAFDATGPTNRLHAIVQASGSDADPRSLPMLVEQLDSQDPAARMLAIRALENRTGTTLGYSHTDPEWKRQESIERWMNYLESGGPGSDLSVRAGDQP